MQSTPILLYNCQHHVHNKLSWEYYLNGKDKKLTINPFLMEYENGSSHSLVFLSMRMTWCCVGHFNSREVCLSFRVTFMWQTPSFISFSEKISLSYFQESCQETPGASSSLHYQPGVMVSNHVFKKDGTTLLECWQGEQGSMCCWVRRTGLSPYT